MEKPNRSKIANILSALYLLLAIVLLLAVFSCCIPQLKGRICAALAGNEFDLARTAFRSLTEGLKGGEPVKAAFSETAEILLHP